MILKNPSQQVYYQSLVRWNVVDEIVFLTHPSAHPQVRDLIIKTLDQAVMTAVLSELADQEHSVFLDLCRQQYADEELMTWLEKKVTDIRPKLQTVIRQTKTAIRQLLEEELKRD